MSVLSSCTVPQLWLASFTFETGLQFLGRFHPMILHAPIGLLIGLAALELFALLRRRPLPNDIRAGLAWLVALTAVVSAASGLALSQEQSATQTLQLHLWLGIAVAVAAVLTALLQQRRRLAGYAVFLLLTLGLLIPAGHLGASMTHGPDFLFEPLMSRAPRATAQPSPAPSSPTSAPTASDLQFTATILPILASRCTNCHGTQRQKGGLALHTLEDLRRGSKNGPILDAVNPSDSEMLIRIRLPLEDDDHMPPAEKPQLTAQELATLEAWIKTASVAPASNAATATHGETAKPAGASLPPPIAPEKIAVITAELIHIEPVAQGSTLFVIDTAAVAATTTDESLARLLSPIRANIAELSLARSKITDASAPLLASLPNLRRLNLSATAITDATLTALANHPALEDLTLARTKTSDCASLASIPHLKHLYVWDTLSTPEVLVALSAKRPDLLIDSGAPSRDPVVEAEAAVKFTGDLPPPGVVQPQVASLAGLAPSNTTCPVSGADINPDRVILYKGKLIAFCCEKCAAEFWLNPEKFADKVK